MKSRWLKIGIIALCVFLLPIIVSNILVWYVSNGKCYDDIDAIPHNTFGLLLGTGRSSAPSPYYDARIQAAADLYKAGKVDYIIVSGENLGPDYNEVDSMLSALKIAGIPVTGIDYHGKNTYVSLNSFGDVFGYSYPSLTIISQPFQNRRAVFYGALLFDETPIAYNARDTDSWYWNIRRFVREALARTKAVLAVFFTKV